MKWRQPFSMGIVFGGYYFHSVVKHDLRNQREQKHLQYAGVIACVCARKMFNIAIYTASRAAGTDDNCCFCEAC